MKRPLAGGMSLHERVARFCDKWGPGVGPNPEYRQFVTELRAIMEAFGESAIKLGMLPSTDHQAAKSPADAEAAGKREYLRVTGQLGEDRTCCHLNAIIDGTCSDCGMKVRP